MNMDQLDTFSRVHMKGNWKQVSTLKLFCFQPILSAITKVIYTSVYMIYYALYNVSLAFTYLLLVS